MLHEQSPKDVSERGSAGSGAVDGGDGQAALEPRFPRLLVVLMLLAAAAFAGALLSTGEGVPFAAFRLLSDDTFYYLEIAQNVVAGRGSTFDGITTTNGYHPLWLAVLVAAALVLPVHGTAMALFIVAVATLCAIAGALILHRLLTPSFGVWAVPAATLYWAAAQRLALTGMEVVLVFVVAPLMVAAFLRYAERPAASRAAAFGLCAGLLALARLDALLYVAAFAAAAVVFGWRAGRRLRGLALDLAGFAAGALPLFVYLLANLLWSGWVLPVSGVAKGLRLAGGLSATSLASFSAPSSLLWYLAPGATGLLTLTGLVVLVLRRWPLLATPRAAAWWLLCTVPVAFYVITALRSDWPLWEWYFYPLVLGAPVGAALAATEVVRALRSLARVEAGLAAGAGAAIALFMSAYLVMWPLGRPPGEQPFLQLARTVSAFAEEHPGRFAMGDRAGMVAFLTREPVVQLEGLAADPAMVRAIATQQGLLQTLLQYEIDWYVALNPSTTADGCRLLREPRLPGPKAPTMQAVVCTPPYAVLAAPEVEVFLYRVADLLADRRGPPGR